MGAPWPVTNRDPASLRHRKGMQHGPFLGASGNFELLGAAVGDIRHGVKLLLSRRFSATRSTLTVGSLERPRRGTLGAATNDESRRRNLLAKTTHRREHKGLKGVAASSGALGLDAF